MCAPGLEALAAKELQGLGLAGELFFSGSLRDLYRANLHLGSAERVLLRLGSLRATVFPEFRRKAAKLPWERFLRPGRPIALKVSCLRSRLYHESAVAERLAGAVEDRLKRPSPVKKQSEEAGPEPAQLISARFEDDVCTISMDSSGEPLHRRGWRLAAAKAPLKESLAFSMLKASGWDAASTLIDPFCGSGTIAIEAALLAQKAAPGRSRRFAFMDWPGFDAGLWAGLLALVGGDAAGLKPRILASDRDAGAVRAAQANAARAGVSGLIEFSCKALSAVEPPPAPGWVVTNPPYGVRLKGSGDLRDLYARFGRIFREKCPGWHAAVLCGDLRLMRSAALSYKTELLSMNGGLKVSLAVVRP